MLAEVKILDDKKLDNKPYLIESTKTVIRAENEEYIFTDHYFTFVYCTLNKRGEVKNADSN